MIIDPHPGKKTDFSSSLGIPRYSVQEAMEMWDQ